MCFLKRLKGSHILAFLQGAVVPNPWEYQISTVFKFINCKLNSSITYA